MGCCGKNSDDGRTDDVEMRGGASGKGGKAGKWGEFCTQMKRELLVIICRDKIFKMEPHNDALVVVWLQF